jgi:hypothetical protein
MANRTWLPGTLGNWFTAANWTTTPPPPNNFPQPGDTAIVRSGTPTVAAGASAIADLTIVLGGPDDIAPVTLQATSGFFAPDVRLSVVGPGTGQAGDVTFQSFGSTTYRGRLFVLAKGGSLAIDAASDGSTAQFMFEDASGGSDSLMLVTQEASLTLAGRFFTNDAFIEIEGVAEIAAGATLSGDGILTLEGGGRLTVNGAVGADQHIDFSDGTGRLTIADVADFQGKIGLPTTATGSAGFQLGGARIDLPNVQAQSKSFSNGVLTLHSGPDGTGAVVAQLHVELVFWEDLSPLAPAQQNLTAADFRLGPDGSGGTLITYTPQGVQVADASLPVSVTAPTGSRVSLASILQQSFGTAAPAFYSLELMPAPPVGDSPTDPPFWGQPQVQSTWLVNGQPISGLTVVTSIDSVELLVGNNIDFPVQLQAQVTAASTGNAAGYVLYNVWTTPSAVAQAMQASGYAAGAPTPGNIVNAALAFNASFPGQLDDNLCNWIGDSVAAAAGATMPLPDADVDPNVNVEGGFWRIAYRGTGSNPQQNWSGLVRPGDIVRMAWLNNGGHTTTVLGGVNDDGTITVYDNADTNSLGQGIIGVHSVAYWNGTNPAGTTIYRLDPDQQYLIKGTALTEVIQGTVYDDLILPGGGADTIVGGPADNEIQGVTAVLNGITVTDFNSGDTLDFTDLDPASVQLSYAAGFLTVGDGVQLARLALLGLGNPQFGTAPDGSGGTLVFLAGGHGDVHMVCFDGLNYDFQAVGDFVAVEWLGAGQPGQVQIRTAAFPGAASITTMLAVNFGGDLGGDRITFAVGRDHAVHVDGVADTALQVGMTQSFAGGTLSELSAGVYQLTWNSGQRVTVTDQGDWLDWTVALAPHDGPGSVRGLLGSNGGAASNFQLPDGTVLVQPSADVLLTVFADAWSVTPGTSLLDDGPAPDVHLAGERWHAPFAG